jgi:hypothetical protein
MMSGVAKASLLGERAQIAVERALSEFRSGRPVLITSGSDAIAALPVDGMTEAMLVAFRRLSRPVRPFLLVTARRARHRPGGLGPYRHRTSRLLRRWRNLLPCLGYPGQPPVRVRSSRCQRARRDPAGKIRPALAGIADRRRGLGRRAHV